MKKIVLAALLLSLLGACSKCSKGTQGADPAKVTNAPREAPPPADGAARVVFASDKWTGGRGQCSEGSSAEGCDSQWHHTETKQLTRVFVIPVKDKRALTSFMEKLESDVKARDGVAEHFTQGELSVMRFLERARQGVDGGSMDVASINYVLVGKDQKAVHLITSIVPFDEQQPADQRLRDLLTTAAWSE
jgi:hypothetical protein